MKFLLVLSASLALSTCEILSDYKNIEIRKYGPSGAPTSLSKRASMDPSKELVQLSERDASLAELEPRFLGLSWLTWSGVKAAIGVWGLLKSAYDFSKDCSDGEDYSSFDCLWSASDAALNFFLFTFYNVVGFKRDIAVFRADGSYIVPHIPVGNGTLHLAAIRSNNSGDWSHIATVYTKDDREKHHLLYRLAAAADLGRPNLGNEHHIRVQNPSAGTRRRTTDENISGGFVVDYIWSNNDESIWSAVDNNDGLNEADTAWDMSWAVTNDMVTYGNEVECVIPAYLDSNGGHRSADHGVMAYGWNNAPFNWANRGASWKSQCAQPVITCSVDTDCEGQTHCTSCYCSDGSTEPYRGGKCILA